MWNRSLTGALPRRALPSARFRLHLCRPAGRTIRDSFMALWCRSLLLRLSFVIRTFHGTAWGQCGPFYGWCGTETQLGVLHRQDAGATYSPARCRCHILTGEMPVPYTHRRDAGATYSPARRRCHMLAGTMQVTYAHRRDAGATAWWGTAGGGALQRYGIVTGTRWPASIRL